MSGTTDIWINVTTGNNQGSVVLTHTFSVSDRILAGGNRMATDLLRSAMKKAFDWFNGEYTKLRFTGYAIQNLGYKVQPSTWRKKRRMAKTQNPEAMKPNVYSGNTRTQVLSGSRTGINAVGGATSGIVSARLVHPGIPRGRNTITNATLNMVTPAEAKRIADMFQAFLTAGVNSMTVTTFKTRRGDVRTRATMAQEDTIQAVRSMRGRGNAFEVVQQSRGNAASGA